MTLNIAAHTDFYERPDWVMFHFGGGTNHEAWHCVLEIGNWLIENEIEYTIISFQCNQSVISIPSEEARVLIRLTYEMYIEPPDEPIAWF
jgi:hypothetical protein